MCLSVSKHNYVRILVSSSVCVCMCVCTRLFTCMEVCVLAFVSAYAYVCECEIARSMRSNG